MATEATLDFEKPIVELESKLQDIKELATEGDKKMEATIGELETKISSLKKKIYSNLSGWQRVQVARHPHRPYTLDYIYAITSQFVELHGDRTGGDDKAIVGGLAKIGGDRVMVIGHQKGRDTKSRQYRNFGMANPEGYRKALRLMKMAEKFNRPVITLIDTPGAYPGLHAEEYGQAEAIARNLREMAVLKVPILCIVIGEGASGGALGIGVGDKVLMLENTWYSVISPESCSSILWRSWDYKQTAAEALKLTANNNKQLGIVDGVVQEPLGGAHKNPTAMYKTLKSRITKELKALKQLSTEDMIAQRIEKFCNMGVYHEG